jgi:Fe2+ or Zn2+ uptake regulation protein
MATITTTNEARDEQDLRRTLRRRGQRVTSQRLVIHRALVELGRHVTAEEVFGAVSQRLPGISRPTVYATLDLFDELGIVRRISPGEGPILYDPRVGDHSHLVCRRCGAVEDLDVTTDATRALAAARRRGFEPHHAGLAINGLCARCAKADNPEPSALP